MRTRVARAEKSSLSLKVTESPTSLEEVLRLLLNRVTSVMKADPTALGGDSSIEEIVFDTELDGERYLLLRMPKTRPAGASLSPREQEIVRMVAQGHPNKIIADVLDISMWTVCTHLRRIFGKLGVGSRAAMVARSLRAGTINDFSAFAQKPPAASANAMHTLRVSEGTGKRSKAAAL